MNRDHEFYLKWARESIETAIEKLETSHEASGNNLVRAVISRLQEDLELLRPNHHQLY